MTRDRVVYDRTRKGWVAYCHGIRSSTHASESGALRTFAMLEKILGSDYGKA